MPGPDRRPLIAALKTIKDPEVGLDIVSMGLVYNTRIDADQLIIDMTMTTPYCPLAPFFTQEVTRVAKTATGYELIKVQFVFEPLWHPKMVDHSESA